MKTHIFIIVRYSLLTKDGAGWQIGKGDYDSYREKLFDPERLSQHESLFKKITLRSLINQKLMPTKDNMTLLVLTSDELPLINLRNLEGMLSSYPWAKIIQLPNNKPFTHLLKLSLKQELKRFNETVCFCTTRLDDDDALSSNFLEELHKYLDPKFLDYCVSFGSGYAGIYNHQSGKYEAFYKYHYPKIAIGLSHINTYEPETDTFGSEKPTIFHKGNHLKIDLNSPTIIDSTKPLFLRTIHSSSDTNNDKQLKLIKGMPTATPEIVRKLFSLDDESCKIDNLPEHQYNMLYNKIEVLEKLLNKTRRELQLESEKQNQLLAKLNKQEEKLKMVEDQKKRIQENRNRVEHKLKMIKQSRSWRYTMPLRKLLNLIKKIGIK